MQVPTMIGGVHLKGMISASFPTFVDLVHNSFFFLGLCMFFVSNVILEKVVERTKEVKLILLSLIIFTLAISFSLNSTVIPLISLIG